jgi:hypothetical protein
MPHRLPQSWIPTDPQARARSAAAPDASATRKTTMPPTQAPGFGIHHSPRVLAQSRLIRQLMPGGGGAPLQRMVAIASDDLSNEQDSLILNNLDYALGQFGGPVGDFQVNRRFHETAAGGRLGIVAHGGPGHIGGYDADGVADALTLEPNPLPRNVASIVLYSCNAGMDQAQGPDSSLVHGLSAALRDKGYEIGVEGQKGIGFGFRGIGERTTQGTEQEGDAAWFGVRNQLFTIPPYSTWCTAKKEFKPADELLQIAGGLDTAAIARMDLQAKAAKISEIMEPFWREAEARMGSQLYDHLRGWVRVLSYVGGGQLVQDSR